MKTSWRAFLLLWLLSLGVHLGAAPVVVKLRAWSAPAAEWKRSSRTMLPAQFRPLLGGVSVRPYVPDELLQAVLRRAQQLSAARSLWAQRWLGELERILVVELPEVVDTALLIAKLRRHPEVEYAEALPERFLCGVPNDPLVVDQYALRLIRAFDAWDVLPADAPPVLVGVVDTGIDPTHPDLAPNLFLNPGEMGTDANGRDKRFNGVDDDGNGFVDDWRGWDFAAGHGSRQDNDPSPGNAHGTHVAGIIGAVVNNATGIAGVVPRVRLLAVKVGPDAPGSSSVVNSYQGILYAAAMGAAVINCSWGGPGHSEAEHDIVRAAVALGSVVVAAAGNDGRNAPFYPAAYPEVLSVTATDSTDGKAWYANYHSSVDVSAPGDELLSTIPGGLYTRMSGTSMAAPVASSVVALVRQKFPALTPYQAMARVMMTADAIRQYQPFAGLIGWGRVNALQALTTERLMACRIDSLRIADSDGDGFFDAGDTLLITCSVENVLDAADSLVVSLFSPFVPAPELLRGQVTLVQMGSGERRQLPQPLLVQIPPDVPDNAVMELRFSVRSSGKLVGREWTSIILRPVYRTLAANHIAVTFNSRGNIAFNDYPENLQGDGFRWKGSPNLLFEGALMAGISAGRLSNVARGAVQNQQDRSFVAQEVIAVIRPGVRAALEAEALFADQLQPGDLGVAVRQWIYQFDQPGWQDFVLVLYELVNQTAEPFTSLHVGWYLDWDISPTAQGDMALYDDSSGVGYVLCQTCSSPLPMAGAVLLSDARVNFYAIDNDGTGPELGVYDGFTRQEKWTTLSSGIARKQSRVTDVSMVLAAGPLQLAPGDTARVAFALVAGMTLEEVRRAASAARQAAASLGIDTVPWEPFPRQMAAGVFPHPWMPGAPAPELILRLPEQRYVRIRLIDELGREVALVAEGLMQPGQHSLRLSPAALGSGAYFLYVTAEREGIIVPLLVVR